MDRNICWRYKWWVGIQWFNGFHFTQTDAPVAKFSGLRFQGLFNLDSGRRSAFVHPSLTHLFWEPFFITFSPHLFLASLYLCLWALIMRRFDSKLIWGRLQGFGFSWIRTILHCSFWLLFKCKSMKPEIGIMTVSKVGKSRFVSSF